MSEVKANPEEPHVAVLLVTTAGWFQLTTQLNSDFTLSHPVVPESSIGQRSAQVRGHGNVLLVLKKLQSSHTYRHLKDLFFPFE